MLTDDSGTSSLAQGCTGQHVLVQIERFEGRPPPVRAHTPPRFVARD
ncbi:trimethylamine-N-oxide reductase domain protein [Mycobacteroides abscessus subsp. bolletii 1513]|uniref:Trimethylamine-N-oxide reductase domain protein n=1 Tax=Mycobacteroides abscessus subsp. bolletii 1513 TaxID=1299321 RepID=X8DMR8_9MYCO|nr:trimethylamine-N-oxide reductase domain protein [Mycobacteroides abscessus subsp. bolletii 1513]